MTVGLGYVLNGKLERSEGKGCFSIGGWKEGVVV